MEKNIPIWAYETIELKKPDPMWIEKGVQERDELYHILTSFGVKQVEHVGSTAIPNLPAKPIIDVMATLPSFELINNIAEKLSLYDWHYIPPELDKQYYRRFFVKVKHNKRAAHLHLMLEGEKRWGDQLTFRDTLRANAHLAAEYAAIKCQLAQKFRNDREQYTQAKTAFIHKVLSL
ncbi:GrpB family protein [Fictibacillus iocasae]|uniref:GrpB family protein n=1 Tax=Fictibacillus iocasae TaxID=2715437 RepID=A0ABW2NQN2_9BACL